MKQFIFIQLLVCIITGAKAQWTPVNGIYGGMMSDLVVSRGVLVTSVYNGGVYVSSDTGKWWIKTNNEINGLMNAGKYVYGNGQYSSDNGLTWNGGISLSGDEAYKIGDSLIARAPQLFGATVCSIDSGLNWHPVNIGLNHWSILRQSGNRIYAGTSNGLLLSTDNCNSWTTISASFGNQQIKKLIVKDSVIHALTSDSLHTSFNWGVNWTVTFAGQLNVLEQISNRLFLNDQFGYLHYSDNNGLNWDTCFYSINLSSIVNVGNKLFASTEDGIYKSSDNGLTWTKSDNGINERMTTAIEPCGPYLFASAFREGLYRSADKGLNWQKVNLPFNDIWSHISRMYVEADTICVGLWGHGIAISRDFGTTWSVFLDNKALVSVAKKGNVICASDVWGFAYTSINGGNSWITSSSNVPGFGFNSLEISDSCIFASSSVGIFKSVDNGLNWITLNSNQGAVTLKYFQNKLFASTYDGKLSVSNDQGYSFTTLFWGNTSTAWDYKISNNNIWVVNEKNKLFYSSDGGNSFDTVMTNLQTKFYAIAVTDSFLLLGTDRGIWRSPEELLVDQMEQSDKHFEVFPNPASDRVEVLFPDPASGMVSLYDYSGRLLLLQKFKNSGSLQINVTGQSAGLYLLKFDFGKNVKIKKIVVVD